MSDYEDMQNGLKQFGKKVIDILCDCYCDLIEEHYYRDTRCVNQNSNPAAAAAGWIRVEWRGTEYTLPIGINYDMEPAICFDMEGDHWEDETHAWMFIASRTFDKLRAQEARVAELEAEARVAELEAEVERLRDLDRAAFTAVDSPCVPGLRDQRDKAIETLREERRLRRQAEAERDALKKQIENKKAREE